MSTGQGGDAPVYWPNSRPGTPDVDPSYMEPAWDLGNAIVDRYDSTQDHDDYTHGRRVAEKLGMKIDDAVTATR
jgi:hypothetical protein